MSLKSVEKKIHLPAAFRKPKGLVVQLQILIFS